MPTKPTPTEISTQTQELDAVDPNTSPEEVKWHTYFFKEHEEGMSYQHEFGQALTERAATDRILTLHGLSAMPDGAKVWHEEVKPVPEEAAPVPAPVPEPTPDPVPSEPENPVV